MWKCNTCNAGSPDDKKHRAHTRAKIDAPTRDPEINAIAVIVRALAPFDFDTRTRMLRCVNSWAEDDKTQVVTENTHD